MHDPEVYKDSMTFNPDCLIAKHAETDPFDFAFGEYRHAHILATQAYTESPTLLPLRPAVCAPETRSCKLSCFGATVLSVHSSHVLRLV
jgi:hypothetical protein